MATIISSKSTRTYDLATMTPEQWREILGGGGSGEHASPIELFSAVGWLYRCVQLRANAVAATPWQIVRADGEPAADSESGDSAVLPWASALHDLLWKSEAALALGGVAYWHKLRSRSGKIVGLRWFAPGTITAERWDPTGFVGVERGVASGKFIAARDIVRIALPNPLHESAPGVPPAQAALRDAAVLHNANVFVEQFFSRGAIRATLLSVEGNPPQQEMQRLEAWWRRFFSGVRDAYSTAAVRAGVTPVVVGEGLESLSNAQLTTERREGISTAMGVPHSLVMSNAANYATSENDRLIFYESTIVPELKLIQSAINEQLLAGLGLRFQSNYQELAIFQRSESDRAEIFRLYVASGVRRSVAARMAGLFLPQGVEYEALDDEPLPLAVAPPVAEAEIVPPEPADAADRQAEIRRLRRWAAKRGRNPGREFRSEILSPDEIQEILGEPAPAEMKGAMILQLDPDGDGEPDEAERKLQAELEQQANREIAAALRRQREILLPDGAEDMEMQELLAQINLDHSILREAVARSVREAAALGVDIARQQLERIGAGFDYTLAHTAAQEWAHNYTDEDLQAVAETTRRAVVSAIERWYGSGAPLPELTAEIQRLAFSENRAATIAATATTKAAAEGTHIGYVQSGVVSEEVWLTANDEIVCPICGALAGRTVALGGSFFETLPQAQRDELLQQSANATFERPPAHPKCRCRIGARIRR